MQQIVLKNNEKREIVLSWFGNADLEEQYEVILEGDGSEADIYGVFFGHNKTHYKSNVRVVHKGKNTRANVLASGVVIDNSNLDFSGMLRVERGAKGTKTFFRANLMILSPHAEAFTFPGLEIEENDISQGGHAATVGRVNEEQMFYLMSRGLSESEAKKLVIQGFFEPVLKQISGGQQDSLRTSLSVII
jgi:Fe-S cluster assembly scaffold protein SufB